MFLGHYVLLGSETATFLDLTSWDFSDEGNIEQTFYEHLDQPYNKPDELQEKIRMSYGKKFGAFQTVLSPRY